MDTEINYANLSEALYSYKLLGYVQIDVPWRVPVRIIRHTFPHISGDDDTMKMVGSAEQSFLYLQEQNKLEQGRYVACSPCYRKESLLDDLHRDYFMKVELYQNYDINEQNLSKMISHAYETFRGLCEQEWWTHSNLQVVKTDEGYDINLNDIEIGSYGIRTLDNGHSWIYGTGLAEPRFSAAFNMSEEVSE